MLLAAMLLSAATPAPLLLPTGPWVVHMEENLCLLERTYPAADRKVSLIFQPLLDLDEMEVFVVSNDHSDQQHVGSFTATIEPGQQTSTGRYFSVYTPKTKSRLTRLTTDRSLFDQLKNGDTLRLKAKPLNLAFRIVQPEKARAALKGCVDDLKKSWGIDPEMASRTVTPADGNPGRYFGPDAYPPEALAKRIFGRVIALLNITPEGTVEHCRIVSSAGEALNAGTCKVAMRIRFKPARDKNGVPLPGIYVLPVRWTMFGAPS